VRAGLRKTGFSRSPATKITLRIFRMCQIRQQQIKTWRRNGTFIQQME
jgi:hypothetical protein